MAKFTEVEKILIVKKYLDGTEGIKKIASTVGVHHTVLLNWVKQYELHGDKAFKKRYTNYSVQYKLDVLNYMNENGTSIRETAAIFNIPTYLTIVKWKNDLENIRINALQPKKKGRQSMKQENKKQTKNTPTEGSVEALQTELERLRMENVYLKRLNTLVQNKGRSPNKTKKS